mgnify:CR=1 FL=1
MALVLKDRVKEQTTTTGTGAVTLGGAISGFDTFAAVGNSNTTYYAIVSQSANEWEVGIGTYTASGTTLSRDTILESSNSDSAVNFSAGIKDVFVTYPADKSVYADAAGTVNTGAIAATSLTLTTDLAVADGGTGASSLTDGGVLLGSGTGAITAMAVLTDGQMIVGDGTGDPVAESGATLRSSIGVDAAGTDNSTNVTLAGSLDYLTLSGQEITRGAIVLTTDVTGTLPIANGGTNATSAGAALTALGAAARGANSDITSLTGLTTDLTVAQGGTGASSLTDGGVLLGSGTGAITPMAVLTDGQMIVGDGTGDPVAESGATLRTSIGVDAAGTDNSTNVTLAGSLDYLTISGQEITRGAVVLTTDISGTLPIANGGTNATSAGAARTALGAAASGANSDITSITGLTTDLTVAQGGTGAGTFAANGILFGNGTSAIGATAVGTDGHILTSNGSGVAPTFQAAAAGGATSINGLSDAAASGANSLYLGTDTGNGNTAANTGVGQGVFAALDGTVYGNVAIGQRAGQAITSGGSNTCLGWKAGEDITTGPRNIIIGPSAAKTLTTGNDNIVIGSDECGENLSTGDSNTIIGPTSGKATATNSQCLILGHNANPSSNSVAREITLGSSSITSFRIPGVGFYSLNGNVGIGTAAPAKQLSITKSALATINTLTDGATITPDFDAGQNFSVTLAGNRTLANPTNIDAGQTGSIFITQDGTGSRTLSFGSYWDFAGGTAPTLSTAAASVDRIDYIVRTGTSIHAVATLNLS